MVSITLRILLVAILMLSFITAASAQGEPKGPAEDAKHRPTGTSQPAAAHPSTAPQQGPRADWEVHVDWSIADQGYVDCPKEYVQYPKCEHCSPDWRGHEDCLNAGGRACMMRYAIHSAKKAQCNQAVAETLVTQCHNPAAQDTIRNAGVDKVCGYLKRKEGLTTFQAVPQTGPPTPANPAHQ